MLILFMPSAILCTGATRKPVSEARIIGKWDSRIRSNGAGITLEFLTDGTITEASDFEIAGRYALKNGGLTTYIWNNKDNHEK